MSESHELFKYFMEQKRKTENAKMRGSKYVSDYEKDESIARSEFREKEREEKEDDDRTNKLFGNIY